MKQLNFNDLFKNAFNEKSKKEYIIRQDSNLAHDIQFLSSLVHDSFVNFNDIKISENNLLIPIDRFCNEYSYQQENIYVKSILKFENVKYIKFMYGKFYCDAEEDFFLLAKPLNMDAYSHSIEHICISDLSYDRNHLNTLIIKGSPYHWQLEIVFNDDFFASLEDQESLDLDKKVDKTPITY